MKLLIADDAEDLRLMLTVYLKAQGFEVVTAADGMEAVDAFMRGNFDAVILDCAMPHMDGFSAAQVMRHIESLRREAGQTRVGFLTGHYKSEGVGLLYEKVQATRFWEKPIDPPLFVAELREWLAELRT